MQFTTVDLRSCIACVRTAALVPILADGGNRVCRSIARLWGLLLFISLSPVTLTAQEIQLAQQRGPYYVGEPTVIQIQVNGVKAGQDVNCRLKQADLPDGLSITGPQVGQTKSSFAQIINGRMTSSESINFKYNFFVTATKTGVATVGPFSVTIDSQTQELEGVELDFEELEDDPDMAIEVSLPRETLYVGEQVPLTIRWLYAGDQDGLQIAYSNLQIRSPLFEQFDFVDSQPTSRTTLSIATAQRIVELDAIVSQEQRDGRDYVVVTAERTLRVASPGEVKDMRVSGRTERVARWGRDFFGDARPISTRTALATAPPLSFRVLPIPTDNRPVSFSGAVGNGYSIEVAANRSVVRVGDPISLDVKLTGDGDVARLALPPLSTILDANRFQLPTESPSGSLVGNTKQFKVSVRIKDQAVDQIPALPFSWFDPRQLKFVTAYSMPIALQVQQAQIVSASDVVAANSGGAVQSPPSTNTAFADEASAGESSDRIDAGGLSFLGANLAIENRLPSLLISTSRVWTSPWLSTVFYIAGVAAVLLALAVRMTGRKSPEQMRKQALFSRMQQQVRLAERLPMREATTQVAAALRQLIAAFPDGDRALASDIVAQCERFSFAPLETDDSELKQNLIAQALVATQQLVKK